MAAGEQERAAPSVAASASQRVQAILEAAEASAAEIRREARDEAEAIRRRARAEAGRASASIDAALGRLEELHGELGALIASLRTQEQASLSASAGPEPGAHKPAAVAPAPSAPAELDMDGVRLIALNMALDGTPREQAARFLAESFSVADPERLLDEVYASAGA